MKRGVKIAVIAAAVLVAALTAVLVVLKVREGRRPEGPSVHDNITYYYGHEDEITRFIYDSAPIEGQIAGGVDSYLTVDGTVAIARAGTGLYRIDKDGILRVYPAGVGRAVLSLDNNFILFSTATQVFIYDHSTGGLTEIEGLNAESVFNLVISPSGKVFGVTVVDEAGVARSYTYSGGRLDERTEADSCIIAVSDDGRLVYYMEAASRDLTGKLYCVRDGEEHVIAESGVSAYFELNRDLSEITFDIDDKTYYSIDGGAAEKLSDASILTVSRGCCSRMGGDGCTVLLRNLSTIFGCMYYTVYTAENENSQTMNAYDLYYVNAAHRPVLLAEGATQFAVNADGDGIFCVVDGSLYEVSCYSPERPKLLASGVYTFAATSDRRQIYVLDQYARLNCLSGGRMEAIMSNVSYFIVTKDDVCLYLSDYDESSGTLHWAQGTETEVIAEKVFSVEAFAGGTAYYAEPKDEVLYADELDEREGVFDVYFSADSREFELRIEQARMPIDG